MAEQDFDVKIRTTADTSGIKQVEAELSGLAKKAETGGGIAGLGGAAGGGGIVSLGKAAEVTKEAAEAAGHFGVNIGKARAEAVILARELATGMGTTRTLGSLLGALGLPITIAGTSALALWHAITSIAEEQLKVNEELDKQVDSLGKSAEKWRELARNARTQRDVFNIGKEALPQLEELSTKLKEVREKELSGWEQVKSAVYGAFTTPAGAETKATPIEDALERQKKAQEELMANAIKLANANIEAGQKSADAWESLRFQPVQEGIAAVNEKLRDLRKEQEEVDRSTDSGIRRYVQLGDNIQVAERQLKELTDTRRKQREDALNLEKETKDLTEGLVKETDKQVTNYDELRRSAEAIAAQGIQGLNREQAKTEQLENQTREKEKQNRLRAFEEIGAAGSVAGAALANIQANRAEQIQQDRIAAEQRDLEDRRRRGAYGQTELGEAAFKGAKQDFTAGKGDKAGSAEIVRAIDRLRLLWE